MKPRLLTFLKKLKNDLYILENLINFQISQFLIEKKSRYNDAYRLHHPSTPASDRPKVLGKRRLDHHKALKFYLLGFIFLNSLQNAIFQ